MARRPGEDRFSLSPRARRVAGWLAAVALVAGIALGVRFLGGTGDEAPPGGAAAPSGSVTAAPITFGTALDPETGLVATPARTSRFELGETFAYSVRDVIPPATVHVEVERVSGGTPGIVQAAAPQTLAPEATAIAFAVPVDILLEAFGPGDYRMRIYREPAGVLLAEGEFTLVGGEPEASP